MPRGKQTNSGRPPGGAVSEPLGRCKRCGITKHKHYPCWTCLHLRAADDLRERLGLAALRAGMEQESERRRAFAATITQRGRDNTGYGLADDWDDLVGDCRRLPAASGVG
jgi:hypothetical protein